MDEKKTGKGRRGTSSEIQDLAREILSQRADLMEKVGLDAMKIAALEVVSKKLDEIKRILAANGFEMNTSAPVAEAPTREEKPRVKNPCVQCGREGAWQDSLGQWHCVPHGRVKKAQEAEEAKAKAMFPSMGTTAKKASEG